MSDSLQPHGLQHARLPCPSPTTGACSNSCPLSQWCHPTISSSVIPSPPAFNLSQCQGLFQWVSFSHQEAKVLKFCHQHQFFQWIFRTDFLQNWLVGSPCNPRDSQESSATPQFKSINSLVLSLLYGPALISVHDYWKKHSFWLYDPLSAKWCLCFLICCLGLSWLAFQEAASFNFLAVVTIHTDFGAQEKKIIYRFHFSHLYLPWRDLAWWDQMPWS